MRNTIKRLVCFVSFLMFVMVCTVPAFAAVNCRGLKTDVSVHVRWVDDKDNAGNTRPADGVTVKLCNYTDVVKPVNDFTWTGIKTDNDYNKTVYEYNGNVLTPPSFYIETENVPDWYTVIITPVQYLHENGVYNHAQVKEMLAAVRAYDESRVQAVIAKYPNLDDPDLYQKLLADEEVKALIVDYLNSNDSEAAEDFSKYFKLVNEFDVGICLKTQPIVVSNSISGGSATECSYEYNFVYPNGYEEKGSFVLKNNETWSKKWLPAGTVVTVTETKPSGYTVTPGTASYEHTIQFDPNNSYKMPFENTYGYSPTPGPTPHPSSGGTGGTAVGGPAATTDPTTTPGPALDNVPKTGMPVEYMVWSVMLVISALALAVIMVYKKNKRQA